MPKTGAIIDSPASSDALTTDPSTKTAEPLPPTFRRGALVTLALGTFAVGTEGFMIAAILPTIATSMRESVAAVGQLVTIFSLVYAVSSPVLTALTASWPRRRLLLLSLAGFGVANLVAAAAPGYWWLAAARVLLALSAGLYVPNANAMAGSLAPPAHRGRALAIVNGGITLAVAIGVPLGALVGTHFGWRATFLGVAALTAVALAALAVRLPRDIASSPPAGLKARLAVVVQPGVLPTLVTTTLWGAGAYEVYTYVSPFLASAASLDGGTVGLLLTLLGGAALGGITLGGVLNDRFGARAAQGVALPLLALTFGGLTLSSLLLAPNALVPIVPLIALWGLSGWAFFPPQQVRLIQVAGSANTPVILSLNASFMYLGFSLGAALGSVVITMTSVAWIGAAGTVLIVAAIGMSRFAWSRTNATTAFPCTSV